MTEFLSFVPHPMLTPYIECFWILKPGRRGSVPLQRMPADGRIELFFSFAAASRRSNSDGTNACDVLEHSFVLGVREQGYLLNHFGAPHYVAVRFRPGGLSAFCRLPAEELTGRYISLDYLWDQETVRVLENQLYDTASPQMQIAILESALIKRLQPPESLRMLTHAIALLSEGARIPAIPEVARQVAVSQKHLERLFARYIGLSPVMFGRVARFQRALYYSGSADETSWVRIAMNLGYYDQSHFNKDFRQFTGVAPTEMPASAREFIQIATPH